jgi:hypothetical protein
MCRENIIPEYGVPLLLARIAAGGCQVKNNVGLYVGYDLF